MSKKMHWGTACGGKNFVILSGFLPANAERKFEGKKRNKRKERRRGESVARTGKKRVSFVGKKKRKFTQKRNTGLQTIKRQREQPSISQLYSEFRGAWQKG